MNFVNITQDGGRPRNNRSAVTNGRREFAADGDGRSVWCRRWRDLVLAHLDDLGGEELASSSQIALARRAATLEIELEKQEATLSSGGSIDLDAFNRVSGGLRRMLETLGVERKQRVINDGADALSSYFARPSSKNGGGSK